MLFIHIWIFEEEKKSSFDTSCWYIVNIYVYECILAAAFKDQMKFFFYVPRHFSWISEALHHTFLNLVY